MTAEHFARRRVSRRGAPSVMRAAGTYKDEHIYLRPMDRKDHGPRADDEE